MAFPISWKFYCGDLNFNSDDKNPLKFTVKVNNKAVRYKFKRYANPKVLDTDCGEQTIYLNNYWEQVFKANEITVIEHSYKPIFDSSVYHSSPLTNKEWKEFFGNNLKDAFCATKSQVAWEKKINVHLKICTTY